MKIFRWNIVAITMFPVWSYLSYFTFKLRSQLDPYKDSGVLEKRGRGWVMENIQNSITGVGIASFLFGKYEIHADFTSKYTFNDIAESPFL